MKTPKSQSEIVFFNEIGRYIREQSDKGVHVYFSQRLKIWQLLMNELDSLIEQELRHELLPLKDKNA